MFILFWEVYDLVRKVVTPLLKHLFCISSWHFEIDPSYACKSSRHTIEKLLDFMMVDIKKWLFVQLLISVIYTFHVRSNVYIMKKGSLKMLNFILKESPVFADMNRPHLYKMIIVLLFILISLRPRRNGRYNADDIFKCIFLKENVWIPTIISLMFVPKGPINNIPTLVQIMAWRRPGDKPLSEPMMAS